MFSRFTPLALISAFQPHRAVPGDRSNRPVRRPPDHRTRAHARFRLEGLEERCLLSGISSITEFPLPSGSSLSAVAGGITTGPDGNIWFTDPGANAIGMINPTTHAISLFTIPTSGAGGGGITTGPDGNLWFCEGGANAIGMINPTTHAISSFTIPTSGASPANITAGPDGNVWFIVGRPDVKLIGKINPTTHAITEFTLSATPSSAQMISRPALTATSGSRGRV